MFFIWGIISGYFPIFAFHIYGASPSGGGQQLEASSAHGQRVHPRQSKGVESLLNILQGSGEQDSKGQTVPKEAVGSGGWGLELRGKVRRCGNEWNSLCFVPVL